MICLAGHALREIGLSFFAQKRRSTVHAPRTDSAGIDRSGCSAVARQQLHSDAVHDQIHLERRRGDRSGAVASERFRAAAFAQSHSRRRLTQHEQPNQGRLAPAHHILPAALHVGFYRLPEVSWEFTQILREALVRWLTKNSRARKRSAW